MDDETKTLLRRNLELTRENNKLLKKIRRSAFIGNIMRLVWWAVIIGIPVVLYYYVVQPYYQDLVQTYHDVQTGVSGAQERLYDIPFIGDLVKDFFGASKEAVSPQNISQ